MLRKSESLPALVVSSPVGSGFDGSFGEGGLAASGSASAFGARLSLQSASLDVSLPAVPRAAGGSDACGRSTGRGAGSEMATARMSMTLGGGTARGGFSGFKNKRPYLGLQTPTQPVSSQHEKEISAVRALGNEEGDIEELERKTSHEFLMSRLKSRVLRLEAENTKEFIASYRRSSASLGSSSSLRDGAQRDAKLGALIEKNAKRAEELRLRNEELKGEITDLERSLEAIALSLTQRVSTAELQQMTSFERNQRRLEDERMGVELEAQREETSQQLTKARRQLQNDLVELRDVRLLLQEYRKARLDKLQSVLSSAKDGVRLRACVREMIRHGAQRILQKLEAMGPPLEPWMREVLVNMCHIELQLEEVEATLRTLRRKSIDSCRGSLQSMITYSYTDRFDQLCATTWTTMERIRGEIDRDPLGESHPVAKRLTDENVDTWSSPLAGLPEINDLRTAEADRDAMINLLNDMKQNIAAVICNGMRQAERRGLTSKEISDWGHSMLTFLVSEDFAKNTVKNCNRQMASSA
eukprot:TRINITY_DN14351_c0_g1_i1.p1 TRINITY_DN14351_c0_g1~~TRINITY_DN14351_c0_g1_i1.p1  ORF type:complete len:528 (-),score=138.69 TRINITY_DN14351_c0_g1_i1:251-1834(-)